MGDPVGIGPEITARTLLEVAERDDVRGVAVGDVAALAARRRRGRARRRGPARSSASPDAEAGLSGVIQVLDTGVLGDDLPDWGKVDERAGRAAVTAIETATKAALDEQVAGVVTAPINKESIWAAGSEHLGHTEMLGELTGVTRQDTMFVVRNTAVEGHHLRIFFTTRHMSLRKAIDGVTQEAVASSIREAGDGAEGVRRRGAAAGRRGAQPARRRRR